MDNAIPSGGEAVAFATALGWYSLTAVLSLQMSSASGYVPQWDGTKILLYEAGADGAVLDEVTSGDMSAETITCFVVGV